MRARRAEKAEGMARVSRAVRGGLGRNVRQLAWEMMVPTGGVRHSVEAGKQRGSCLGVQGRGWGGAARGRGGMRTAGLRSVGKAEPVLNGGCRRQAGGRRGKVRGCPATQGGGVQSVGAEVFASGGGRR